MATGLVIIIAESASALRAIIGIITTRFPAIVACHFQSESQPKEVVQQESQPQPIPASRLAQKKRGAQNMRQRLLIASIP
jgi:hypothetical protein